jgi:hypothetical protein
MDANVKGRNMEQWIDNRLTIRILKYIRKVTGQTTWDWYNIRYYFPQLHSALKDNLKK